MSLLFLALLPLLALFHLVMWFAYTSTLFRPETGNMKRIGYLVGFEDRKAILQAEEPQTGFTLLPTEHLANAQVSTVIFGDSFAPSLGKAYSLKTGEPVGLVGINWSRKNGLSQIRQWLADGWFRTHGVKTVVVERVEYAWLETFSEAGDASLNVSWDQELAGGVPEHDVKASRWSFANNGNFKVLLCNAAYLFSPTAFNMTDACMVTLQKKFFTCSYGNKLLFYRGDMKGALTARNQAALEKALANIRDLNALCQQQGLKLCLIVPPVKSELYYDWIEHPFYPESKLLETLQTRARDSGYVDVRQVLHEQLEKGVQDLYYPDDEHWNFPAAQLAAEELAKAMQAPRN